VRQEDRRDRQPDKLFFTADLPKTRSGKIMRRLLQDIAEGRVLGDTANAGRRLGRRLSEGPGRGEGDLKSASPSYNGCR